MRFSWNMFIYVGFIQGEEGRRGILVVCRSVCLVVYVSVCLWAVVISVDRFVALLLSLKWITNIR